MSSKIHCYPMFNGFWNFQPIYIEPATQNRRFSLEMREGMKKFLTILAIHTFLTEYKAP